MQENRWLVFHGHNQVKKNATWQRISLLSVPELHRMLFWSVSTCAKWPTLKSIMTHTIWDERHKIVLLERLLFLAAPRNISRLIKNTWSELNWTKSDPSELTWECIFGSIKGHFTTSSALISHYAVITALRNRCWGKVRYCGSTLSVLWNTQSLWLSRSCTWGLFELFKPRPGCIMKLASGSCWPSVKPLSVNLQGRDHPAVDPNWHTIKTP